MPKTKMPPPTQRDEPTLYRSCSFRAEGDGETSSIAVTLATETPVRVYDWARGRIVDEVLLMSGGEYPRQLPLLDSHSRWSVKDIRGSIRELKTDGGELVGRAHFSKNEEGQAAEQMAREGHLTDVSIGFSALEVRFLDDGEKWKYKGREFTGPLRVVTKWRAFEGSLVPVGADPNAKMSPARRAYFDPEGARSAAMNEEFRKFLTEKGMPEGLDDAAAMRWASENLSKRDLEEEPIERTTTRASNNTKPEAVDVEQLAQQIAARAAEKIEAERKARAAVDTKIRSLVTRAGLADNFGDTLVREAVSLDVAAERILAEQETQRQATGYIAASGPGRAESFRKAMLEGVTARATASSYTPPQGCENFARMRLLDIARRCILETDYGVNLRGMDDKEIFRRAMQSQITTRASDGQAFHTTGNFANLLLDAQNKTLLKGFENTPSTYQIWARNAGTTKDFKAINRARLGEVGNLPTVPENANYTDLSVSDAKESYKVEKHGGVVSLTWETVVNDDLNAFSRMVQLQGSAARRTINKSVYDLLFSNPTMSDGVALFHASSHGANLVTTDFSADGLSAAYAVMMMQTGINSDVILGLMPKFLLHSVTDSAAVNVLLNSISDVVESAANSGTVNIYGPTGPRRLTPIMEPLIEQNDPDSWYLAASSDECDTIEYTFLEGEETPVFEQETAFIQDAVKYKVRQTWGVGVIDYRGLYKSAGNG